MLSGTCWRSARLISSSKETNRYRAFGRRVSGSIRGALAGAVLQGVAHGGGDVLGDDRDDAQVVVSYGRLRRS